MNYLYGSKRNVERRLLATFGSDQQLRSYVRWATLEDHGERTGKFEQGSVLAGYSAWESATDPLTDEDTSDIPHNPSPTML
jgi:hypothetical protein